MSTNNKISNLISTQVPFFVRNDHQTFVAFLEAYYEYLEQSGKGIERIKNLRSYRDIDVTLDEFLQYFYDTFLKYLPSEILADRKLILKHVQDFYRAKGSEKSVRFLTQILFNEHPEIYYPKKDILRASDGKWYIQKSLRIADTQVANTSNTDFTTLEKFIGRQITGRTSLTTAIIESVDRYFEQGTSVDELILSNIDGNFINGEGIYTTFEENRETKPLSANVFGGIINAITIIDGGTRYLVGDPVMIVSSTGSGAYAVVGKVSTGNIASIFVQNGGAGYSLTDQVIFTGGGDGSGANANVSVVLSDGSVHPNTYNIWITLISSEANTNISNAVYSNIGNGLGNANTTLANTLDSITISNVGPVQTISVISPGSNYTEPPIISLTANTRLREAGILGRMDIISGGKGYHINDTINFINVPGGYGSGAVGYVKNVDTSAGNTITEVAFGQVSGHYIGGSGYTQDKLPTTQIVSANAQATGANVVVSAVLGYGAALLPANSVIGRIERVTVISKGFGYTESNTSIDMTQYGDGTANLAVSVIEGVFTSPGRFLNDDGFLSSHNFLEDRDYYQNFSYVIKIGQSLDKYKQVFLDLVHPAGMKLFGEYLLEDHVHEMEEVPHPTSEQSMVLYTKSYVKTGNSININYNSHVVSVDDTIFLENATNLANVPNGTYVVYQTDVNQIYVYANNSNASTGTVEVGTILT